MGLTKPWVEQGLLSAEYTTTHSSTNNVSCNFLKNNETDKPLCLASIFPVTASSSEVPRTVYADKTICMAYSYNSAPSATHTQRQRFLCSSYASF